MWVDWVKVWALEDIEVIDDYDYTCKANPDRSQEELCGSANVRSNLVFETKNGILVGLLRSKLCRYG